MIERIHKIEIAKRLIDVAAEIYFNNGDYLAVVSLAGAAEEILGAIARRSGTRAMIDHLLELDRKVTGGREFSIVNKEINGIRNALKHANDPNEDVLEIDSGEALAMLSRAVANYASLNLEPTSNMIEVYHRLKSLPQDDGP